MCVCVQFLSESRCIIFVLAQPLLFCFSAPSEELYEDAEFPERELSALVASKVYMYMYT
jgi:hypothetical protein